MNFYNTYLSYGLNDKEKARLKEIEKNAQKARMRDKRTEETYYIECEEFSDVLAIPASLVLIRFSALSREEIMRFAECFKHSEAAVFAMDKCPDNAEFICYDNCDILDEESLDWAYMMRVLLTMEKRGRMFTSDDITITHEQTYTAVDVYLKGGELWADAIKIRGGKLQSDAWISSNDFTEVAEWIGDSIVAVWHRMKNYTKDGVDKSFDKIYFSDKLIDMYIFSGVEIPRLALINKLKDRAAAFCDEIDGKTKCELIAILLSGIIYNYENVDEAYA